MTKEASPRLLRYRLVESIVPLAASAGELVAYAHEDGSDIDDVVQDFVDWTYDFIPRLTREGMLPGELPEQLEAVFEQAIAAMRVAPREACEVAVLRAEWTTLRTSAQTVLERFRAVGVPLPSVHDGLLRDISTVPPSERD